LPFTVKLRELGWVEGRNLKVERRYLESASELVAAAREFVRTKLDAVYATEAPAIRAATQGITKIPAITYQDPGTAAPQSATLAPSGAPSPTCRSRVISFSY